MSNPYPRESELKQIETWDSINDLDGLLQFVAELWDENYGIFDLEYKGDKFHKLELATGGWSGNESIVYALERNPMFMMTY